MNNLLNPIVAVYTVMHDTDDFTAYTEKERIREIVSALDNFDLKKQWKILV